MLHQIKLLDQSECFDISRKIQDLREFWTKRHEKFPFYTLGPASYIDAVRNRENYYQQALIGNPILQKSFAGLYENLRTALSTALNSPVVHDEKAALPGFHIFLAHKAFESPMASVHMDLQYRSLDWPIRESIDSYPLISYTLAIELPKNGGGLNLWDVHYQDIERLSSEFHKEIDKLSQDDLAQLLSQYKPEFCEYQVGTMVIHSGHQVHQITPAKKMMPTDRRITLQGHALYFEDVWHLYW
jgi:hypothetical protein